MPYDPRFPATNQARNCYTRYNEYYKCIADKDEDAPDCKFYQKAYRSICPSEWVSPSPRRGVELHPSIQTCCDGGRGQRAFVDRMLLGWTGL